MRCYETSCEFNENERCCAGCNDLCKGEEFLNPTEKQTLPRVDSPSAGWESMDSAPKNGEVILCYDIDGLYWLCLWDEYQKGFADDNAGVCVDAVSWQALPKIPNTRLALDSELKKENDSET